MRPLSEIPCSVLAGVRGVAFDVDDTLTTHGQLSAGAYSALWSLRELGLSLVAVTGRPLGWTDAMASSWPIDVAVGENGAGWSFRRGRAITVGYFHDTATRESQRARLEALRAAVARDLPDVHAATDQPSRRCDLAWDIGERTPLAPEIVEALVERIETAGARALLSSVHAHAVVGDWNKALGVQRAAREALEISIEDERQRWLFVGDSGNDAAAFEFFALTVGVANVSEHLHQLSTPPRWVTAQAHGAGFAELAGAIVEAKRRG